MVDLSGIVVTYNSAPLLEGCLGSLGSSLRGKPLTWELLVVDNASTDGSAALVRERFPQAHLLTNQENRGFAAANNQAIALSSGRFLLFLNPDTRVLADAPATLVAFLQGRPEVGAVGAKLLYPDGRFQHGAFRFPNLWMALLDLFPLHPRLMESRLNGRYPLGAYQSPFSVDHPLGACLMVRRQALEQVGGFDEGYFMYYEEIDLCLRLRRAGWAIYCVPQAEVVHYGGQSTQLHRQAMFVELHRSKLRLFQRHYSPIFRRLARCILHLGVRWAGYRTRRRYRRGELSQDEYEAWRAAHAQLLGL